MVDTQSRQRSNAVTRLSIEYGDGHLDVELPEDAVVVRAGSAQTEPQPLDDPVGATRDALRSPLGCAPLGDQVGRGSSVTIAFPDRVKGGAHATAHRRTTLRLLLDELAAAGVALRDVTLVCAIGLHRKNRREEFESYLGRETLERLHPDQVINHDAEDPEGIVELPPSDAGDVVQMNRRLVESDLTVLIGHTAGNPYGGFSGGYKMPATGLTTWRSIRCHHSPRSMYAADFVPISTDSRFRHQLSSIGHRMESAMPRPFFAVDAVLNHRSEQLAVYAGSIPDVEQATWPLAGARTDVLLEGPSADILVVGLPRNFHYGMGMGSNPLLMMQAIGASVARAKRALRPYPVVIAASVCDGWFNDVEFPAMRTVYDALQSVTRASELTAFEEDIATRYEFVHAYRHANAYHPFHAFSMAYMGGLARELCSAVYVVGARNPGLARGVGATPVSSIEAALAEASRYVGDHPRVIVVPELSKPAYHLTAANSQLLPEPGSAVVSG
jgi:hypothetical protein